MSDQIQLFPLSDAEWRERATRQAMLIREYKAVEAAKKKHMQDSTKKLNELRGAYETLAEAVITGKEFRELLGDDDEAPWRDR
jgi:DNA-binding ferritin-like protein (Dps family)